MVIVNWEKIVLGSRSCVRIDMVSTIVIAMFSISMHEQLSILDFVLGFLTIFRCKHFLSIMNLKGPVTMLNIIKILFQKFIVNLLQVPPSVHIFDRLQAGDAFHVETYKLEYIHQNVCMLLCYLHLHKCVFSPMSEGHIISGEPLEIS